MNILFITPSFPNEDGQNIYTDLAQEIAKKHKLTVVVAEEKKKINENQLKEERGFDVLRVKVGNLYSVSFLEKGLSFITMQRKMKKAIKKYLKDEKYDFILFMAPPITLGNVVRYAMKKFNAMSYLMQKDIFPQNAVDLKIMSKINPAYWYFRLKERKMYKTATVIGCMSQGNINYLLNHNKFLSKEKLEIFPNTIRCSQIKKENTVNIRDKYNIPPDTVLAIYGGNFGKPQGIDFIQEILNEYRDNEKVTFLFFGKGTEKKKLYNFIEKNKIKNALTFDFIPRDEYFQILQEADIGFIFLDYRFTIPNIPSRTLSYFEHSIPIMAATDKNTDYKNIIEQTKSGLWCESNNIEEFKNQFNKLLENEELRKQMGQNGRKYLEKELTTEKAVKILEETYKKIKKEEVKNV